jgi:hypothetical protein
MITHGHDGAIWNVHFRAVFPNTEHARTVQQLRGEGNDTLFKIRDLRNRIAHHEPIFRRNIQEEYDRIRKIISWTDLTAADWIDKIEAVTAMIPAKP